MDLDKMLPPQEETDTYDAEDDTDSGEDLYNAIDLLGQNLQFLEGILKDDITRQFLRRSERISLMQHCGEVMTFIDQFQDEAGEQL